MTLTLQGVLGIVGAVLFAATAIGGAIGLFVHLTIKAALSDFLVRLNGTYLRTALYDQRTATSEARIAALEVAVGGGAEG